MNKLIYYLTIIFLLAGCTTHYQLALRHFDRGNLSYKSGKPNQALKEYDLTLQTLDRAPSQPLHRLLQSTVYHRIHLTDPIAVWRQLDESSRAKHLHLFNIIATATSAGKTPDFLSLAFQEIIKLEQDLKTDSLSADKKWLLIEKDIIIGDFLMQQADIKESTAIKDKIRDAVPEVFIDIIRRYAFYEVAKSFYLEAWAKGIIFIYAQPSVDIKWLTELSQKRLKEICRLLADISGSLNRLERNAEFRDIFREKSHQYLEAINQVEMASLPLSPEVFSSEDKIIKLIGLQKEPEYMVLNGVFHLKEARVKMSTAIEEILSGKKGLTPYFLDALEHLTLVQITGGLNSPSEQQLADSLTEDIYLYLYRISE